MIVEILLIAIMMLLIFINCLISHADDTNYTYLKAIDDKLNVIMNENLKKRIEQNKKRWKK